MDLQRVVESSSSIFPIGRRRPGTWRRSTLLLPLLAGLATLAGADFELTDRSSEVYYKYGLVAGQRIHVAGATEIRGDLHSNGSIALQNGGAVTGNVSAVGTVTLHGTVSGTVSEGAPPLTLPRLASKQKLRQLADRVFENDKTFSNAVIDDIVFVEGDIRIEGSLRGVGTLIAARDVRLTSLPEPVGAPDPQSRLSLIALQDIRIDANRPLRGVLYARRDVVLQKSLRLEGVAIAGRNLSIDKDSQIGFVDFDTTAPVVTPVTPAEGVFLAIAAPTIELAWSDDFSGLDLTTARLLLDGADVTAQAEVTHAGVRFTPSGPLAEGAHTVEASVEDHSDNAGSATVHFVVDTVAPSLAITAPPATVTGDPTPEIALSYSDATSGLDLASLQVFLDGAPLAGCNAGPVSATCEPPELTAGPHTATARIRDRAGNPAEATHAFELSLDGDPPVVIITSPADGQVVVETPIQVTGTVTDESAIASVSVNGQPATLTGNAFSANVNLTEGSNTLAVAATDVHGNVGRASATVILSQDLIPPRISILRPVAGGFVLEAQPTIEIVFEDESGVVPATLMLTTNGTALVASCETSPVKAGCVPDFALPEGRMTLAASIEDLFGNRATSTIEFVVDTSELEIAFTSPADGVVTREDVIAVTGTVGDDVATVQVNGVPADVSGATFSATVPLRQGINTLVALATKINGRTGTASMAVTRDLVAPIVRIDSPREGFVSVNDRIAVTGLVNDVVTGGVQPRVLVNGIEAGVGSGAFLLEELALVRGPNTIEAVGTDAVGNTGRHSITVFYQPPIGARITMESGNAQSARVRQMLPHPLVAVVKDDLGNPLAGRIVEFEVTRNNGTLLAKLTNEPARAVQVPTDGAGRAAVHFTLGDTSGEGTNRVVAKALGVAGEVEFCAGGLPAPAQKILMTAGDNQRGVVGAPLPVPLEALVVDRDGNPIAGFAVTFTVVKGTGLLDGAQTLVRKTSLDGLVRAVLTLALDPGINNNVVSAGFEGLEGLPATFTASGLTPGDPAQTKMSGVVLDNAHTPIPGARVSVGDTSLETLTDDQGQFLLEDVPVGHIHLVIDPKDSPRPEVFPPLAFEAVTVAGQNNTIGQPILIPALDLSDSKIVGGPEDVTLQMPGVPGLELTVFAHSASFPDGSKTGRISITQVHLDKVPMAPPSGTFFMPPAWTIQPHGLHFDPPARISIPNDGMPPGRMIDIYQFDHALYQFINVGKGTTTEDGLRIISDPGFGITSAGWGGCGQPQPPQTCTCQCDDGNKCTQDNCSGQPSCRCSYVNLTNSTCCDGTMIDPSRQGCCNKKIYDLRTQCCVNQKIVRKNPIDDLDACPNRVSNPNWTFEYDGCSNVSDNPAGGRDTHFSNAQHTGACDEHDRCYQTCWGTNMDGGRLNCDERLRNIAVATCNASQESAEIRQSCLNWAQRYYRGLRALGGSAFKSRQKQVCNCC